MPATAVLVHGACHGAWCWEHVLDGLAARGISAVAIDLPGHGASSAVVWPTSHSAFLSQPELLAGLAAA